MIDIDNLFNQSKTEEGRSFLRGSSDTQELINQICEQLVGQSGSTDSISLDVKLKLIRTLRNICCNDLDQTFFSIFVANRMIFRVIARCRDLMLKKSSNESELPDGSESKDELIPEVLAYVQFIANFTANGEHAVAYLMSGSGSDLVPFQDLLAVCTVCRNAKITAAALAVIYNCIRVSDSSASTDRLDLFCSNRMVLCQLLLLVMDSCSNAGSNEKLQSDSDEAMEWLVLIGAVWVRECKVLPIFELVGSITSSSTSDSVAVTHEQLILLQLTVAVLEDASHSAHLLSSYRSRPSEWRDLAVTLSSKLVALNLTLSITDDPTIATATASDATSARADADCVVNKIDQSMRTQLKRDFLILALQVVGALLAVLSETEQRLQLHQLKQALLDEVSLMPYLSGLIAGHHVGARIAEKRNYTSSSSSGGVSDSPWEEGVKCVVRNTLQLLGNLVYQHTAAQDSLRECGGLAVVLSHCATDFSNPLAREWALLCVRNATEGSVVNQQYIEALRPQSVSIQDERMRQQGMNVELNPATGKFKFTQTPPTAAAAVEGAVVKSEKDSQDTR